MASASEARTFPCEACGADLVFHIGDQQLACRHCGTAKQLTEVVDAEIVEQDFDTMIARMAEVRDAGRADEEGLSEVECTACGSTVRFAGHLTSSECAYCGSPLQVEGAHQAPHRVPVDGVLPFQVDRESARKNLAAWIRSRWFAPNEFLKRGAQGKFSGIYIPYWTFDTMTAARFTGMRGTRHTVTTGSGKNRRRRTKIRWTPVSGNFSRFFDDILVPASTGIPTDRVAALEPWPVDRCRTFHKELLAGFLAKTYDIVLKDGFVQARQRIDAALHAEAKQRIGGDVQQVTSLQATYDAVTFKHLLLPLWMLAYRFRERVYQVVVNAGTGEVQGDRPYSLIKIALAGVAGAAIAGIAALVASQLR